VAILACDQLLRRFSRLPVSSNASGIDIERFSGRGTLATDKKRYYRPEGNGTTETR